MKFKTDFLLNYISMAPLALAIERSLECNLLSKLEYQRPILDLGCGEGLFAYVLFEERIETGIDLDFRELKRAKQFNKYEELIQCAGHSIPKPDESYTTIFSNSVLEHISDIGVVLDELHRLLAKGGKLYLTLPTDHFDEYSWISRLLTSLGFTRIAEHFRSLYNKFWKHYHYYSNKKWQLVFEKHGFIVDDCFAYNPQWLTTANDLLVPLGLIGYVFKKFLNRWTLLPAIRRIVFFPFFLMFQRKLEDARLDENGSLIFFALSKPF